MNNDKVSFIFHESDMVRMERINRRWFILCIILMLALVGTNAYWITYERQYEYYEITQDSTDGGSNNYIGNDGDINNGTTDN